jgi:hypothetical protein
MPSEHYRAATGDSETRACAEFRITFIPQVGRSMGMCFGRADNGNVDVFA